LFQTVSRYRYFNVKKHKYIWDEQEGAFFKCQGLDRNISTRELHAYGQGLTEEEGRRRALLYGRNEIRVPVHGIPLLLVKEILTPFYVFQLFSVSFWYADEYWMYATAIVVREFTFILQLLVPLFQAVLRILCFWATRILSLFS
jgi:cation-transporting ATPase 13A3/4/5